MATTSLCALQRAVGKALVALPAVLAASTLMPFIDMKVLERLSLRHSRTARHRVEALPAFPLNKKIFLCTGFTPSWGSSAGLAPIAVLLQPTPYRLSRGNGLTKALSQFSTHTTLPVLVATRAVSSRPVSTGAARRTLTVSGWATWSIGRWSRTTFARSSFVSAWAIRKPFLLQVGTISVVMRPFRSCANALCWAVLTAPSRLQLHPPRPLLSLRLLLS
jgi:hypothetical protein